MANLNWEYSKSRKLYGLLEEDEPTVQEKNAMVMMEFESDIAVSMATGNVASWINLLRLYDDEKSLTDQSLEFQRQVAVTVASGIGTALFLHYAGMTSLELMVARHVTLGPITKYVKSPFVVVPAAAFYLAAQYPQIAGPQYQSSMSGQPGLGSAGHGLIYGNKSFSDYWDAISR